MKIKFLGASGTVTGSCFLVGETILVDCGLYQGGAELYGKNFEPLEFNPARLRAVVVTHAHLDHCGRLPLLLAGGFTGTIYMTEASADWVEIVLLDAAKITEGNARKGQIEKPLYTIADVEKTMRMVRRLKYGQSFEVDGGVWGRLHDAGHILGSASVELRFKQLREEKSIIFSGDLGNSPQDLIKPTETIEKADYVVMESTYGDRLHESGEDINAILVREIREVEKDKGVLLIPAFSLERTQEILHRLDHLKKEGKISRSLAVFLDSPMAIKATEVFGRHREIFGEELRWHAQKDDPFDFEGLVMTRRGGESRRIASRPNPKVIIAGSGMMTGGRVVRHALYLLGKVNTRLLFVGYQGEGTLGREILERSKLAEEFNVEIEGKPVVVRAKVSQIERMSAHADQGQLLAWLKAIRGVKEVFLVHGEEGRQPLAEKIGRLGLRVTLPEAGEELELI